MMRRTVKPIPDFAELIAFPPLRTTHRSLALETVPPEQAEVLKRFYLRRHALQTQISGRGATIRAAWSPAAAIAAAESHLVRFEINGRAGLLVVSAAVTRALFRDIDASLSVTALAPADAALLLELAIEDALGRIETLSGCRIMLLSLAPAAMVPGVPMVALTISLDVQRLGASDCLLWLAPVDAAALAGMLDAAAGADKAPVEDLAVPMSVRLAAASPTIGELKTLRRGDVMLVDDECGAALRAVAVIAEHLVAPLDLVAPEMSFSTRPIGGRGSAWEWSMDKPTGGAGPMSLNEAEFDDLPVRVLFEVGRLELSLGELRRLDVGALLPLAREPENAVEIVVSGRRIGRGTLIKIGESLGVRVTRLFDHG
jgi:type III secretion protein Q